jgi:Leucine-rich repeat (LRR) protein
MKMRTLLSISLTVMMLALVMCSKNAGTNPTQKQNAVFDYSDTLALRVILDANGLATTSAGSPSILVMMLDENNNHRIKELNLGSKNLTVIPAQIKALTAMDILRLDTNSITALPPEIGKCTSLVRIQMSNNQLTTLPTEIGSLHSLTNLVLSHNAISSLPQGLWTRTSLQQLDLDYNQLDSLSAQVSNLVNLSRLSLNNNQLAALPSSLQSVSSLQFMQIDNNRICPATLGTSFAGWLDLRAESDWRTTQGTCP